MSVAFDPEDVPLPTPLQRPQGQATGKTPEDLAFEAQRSKDYRKRPGVADFQVKTGRARREAIKELCRRHEQELEVLENELREVCGLPPKQRISDYNASRKGIPVETPHDVARKCFHEPEKREYGIFCRLCGTRLN